MELESPLEGFAYWEEHPDCQVDDWVYAINNGDTRRGYWSWVRTQLEYNAAEKTE